MDRHESFFQPTVSVEGATLFEHCARGLDQSLTFGVHGLPLIGTGDWNDGMNRVGDHGEERASGSAGFCTQRSPHSLRSPMYAKRRAAARLGERRPPPSETRRR